MTEITKVNAQPISPAESANYRFEWAVERLKDLAQILASTGSFGTKDPSIILAKLVAARDLGIPPISGLSLFHYMEKGNSLVPHYKLLSALIKRHPRYDYVVTDWSNKSVTVYPLVDGKPILHPVTGEPISVTVTFEECVKAGFVRDSNGSLKPAWAQHSNIMLLKQAINRVVAAYFPDVLISIGAASDVVFDDVDDEIIVEGGDTTIESRIIEATRLLAKRNGVEVQDVLSTAMQDLGEEEVEPQELLNYLETKLNEQGEES